MSRSSLILVYRAPRSGKVNFDSCSSVSNVRMFCLVKINLIVNLRTPLYSERVIVVV
jgi:hypothetical protein